MKPPGKHWKRLDFFTKTLGIKTALIDPITPFFHGMRAILALEGVDYKKHSGVIAHFREKYIKMNTFPKQLSGIIGQASLIRNQSDYEDFFLVSAEDSAKQLENAAVFYKTIYAYLQEAGIC